MIFEVGKITFILTHLKWVLNWHPVIVTLPYFILSSMTIFHVTRAVTLRIFYSNASISVDLGYD